MGCRPLQFSSEVAGTKLASQHVNKPWGRTSLPSIFKAASDQPIGEVWFVGDARSPLLAKYLFTSENLSVQVHPDDEQARLRGLPCGKTECWFVIDAEPGARIGLGLRSKTSPDVIRRAAVEGSIEQFISWRAVSPGDFFFVPPGTIHAIGAGISLLELQQNSDITYRLYDYGRGRELHLDDGIAVAHFDCYPEHHYRRVDPHSNSILVDGLHFTIVHSRCDVLRNSDRLILPIEGYAAIGNQIAHAGECLMVRGGHDLDQIDGSILVAVAPKIQAGELLAAA